LGNQKKWGEICKSIEIGAFSSFTSYFFPLFQAHLVFFIASRVFAKHKVRTLSFGDFTDNFNILFFKIGVCCKKMKTFSHFWHDKGNESKGELKVMLLSSMGTQVFPKFECLKRIFHPMQWFLFNFLMLCYWLANQ